VGDGSGTKNAITADATPTIFKIQPAAGSRYMIARMIIAISDAGNNNTNTYGALAALTNGITVAVYDSAGIKYYLTDEDFPVKSNSEWADLMFDQDYVVLGGGDTHIVHRWTFTKFGVEGIRLDGDKGEYLGVGISDTLTGLITHRFTVQGWVMEGELNGSLS
jgi:hypothetical protein